MLGDVISQALSSVGLTAEAVSRWLGRPCRCKERQEKLNQLSFWARRVVAGKVADARRYLDNLLDGDR